MDLPNRFGQSVSRWFAVVLLISITSVLQGCEDEQQPADVLIVDVEDLGPLETASIKGRDGGYSAVFGGYSMWLYGDSILSSPGVDGSSWRNNTCSWTEDLDATDGITGFFEDQDELGVPRECLPRTEAEQVFNAAHDVNNPQCTDPCGARRALWPSSMVVDDESGKAYIFYEKIYGEPGEWNFNALGTGVAVLDDPLGRPVRPQLGILDDEPTLLFGQHEPVFGPGAFVDGSYLYTFGCDGDFSDHCKLGRVLLDAVLDRASWQFYSGGQWSNTIASAQTLFLGAAIMSVHYSHYLERYLAIYHKPVDNQVALRTAASPEGPWSAEAIVFEAQGADTGATAYSALAHPEYAHGGGQTEYISYYRATGDWTGEIRIVKVNLGKR